MVRARNSLVREILEWVVMLAVAFVAALLIQRFVASPYTVPTGSMEPTIQVGDNIFAQKVTIELGQDVRAGDIVVFHNPNASSDHDILVKRVIAVGGQTVDLKDGAVYVDGVKLSEPYAEGQSYPLDSQAPGIQISYPYQVPEGSVWMMGDNRENSADSRYFGPVSTSDLIGVAFLRYWPLDRIGAL
ncbi:signal peptidase I [Collinsella vaginalis]|uniref:signal peptidase I n=1 Tax=Collinsella vaginalis TaxID=1870987 RepID=UPI000A269ED3|nr:signal peptidase I [Collinsella vaginalis]